MFSKLVEYGPTVVIIFGGFIAAAGSFWATVEQQRADREKARMTQEIADLNRKIAASVTGDGSYCVLDFMLDGKAPMLMLSHRGDNPVYDATVTITDLEHFDEIAATRSLDAILANRKVVFHGNVNPSQASLLGKIDLEGKSIIA